MFDAALLKSALDRWCAALEAAAPELNALDGRLGDGDLGATLQKCAANVRAAAAGLPDDLAGIFKRCAGACANASGSSFGTLLAEQTTDPVARSESLAARAKRREATASLVATSRVSKTGREYTCDISATSLSAPGRLFRSR